MGKQHLAIDIGASSGRHMIGELKDGKMTLTEVYRFENRLVEKNGHLCWDIEHLYEEVLKGMKAAGEKGYVPSSVGIDTWAVDFVLLDQDDRRITDAVAYRDERTDGIREMLEKDQVLTFQEHYKRTGIQYQKFNTCYQLVAMREQEPELLDRAECFLMIPDYLHFLLCGVKANEYTNASTTALVGAESFAWDEELIQRLELPRKIFQKILPAGSVLGNLRPEVAKEVGYDCQVILPATHDTGSAYLAVPVRKNEEGVFLSSGTWSLMGVENEAAITTPDSMEKNFTNEGGYNHRFRYLKNIMGLWMIQSVRRELGEMEGKRPEFQELIRKAEEEKNFTSRVNVDDNRFLAPASMISEVKEACFDTKQPMPDTTGKIMQCIYSSLVDDYRQCFLDISVLTDKNYDVLYVVGGGCQDQYLNQLTANALQKKVYAGPVEGTAIGNLMVQMITEGELSDLQQAREAVGRSFPIAEFKPGK